MSAASHFWSDDCPERGVALSHAHWRDCDPDAGGHPGTLDRHQWNQCCHCEYTPDTWERERDLILAEERGIIGPSTFAADCEAGSHTTMRKTPLVTKEFGAMWDVCGHCWTQIEPKLATGQLSGPAYGPGKGWVTPRMRLRWDAIAFRLRGLM